MNFTLDYTIESPEDRCKYINEIIEANINEISDHYQNHFDIKKLSSEDKISKQLDKMADYILYSEKRLKSGILNKNRFIRLKKLDTISYEEEFKEAEYKDEDGEVFTKQEKILEGYAIGQSKINNNRRFKKNQVTKEDYIKYPQLKQFLIAEWNLTKRIKKIEENNAWLQRLHKDSWWLSKQDQLYHLKRILTAIRIEKHHYKELITRPAKFTRLGTYTTDYNFDNIFPYTSADIVDYEKSEDIKKQFYYLLKYYSNLKQDTFGEINNDIPHIISCFEDLIDSTDLEPYLFDILVWRIDGLSNELISQKINKKYKLDLTAKRISYLYVHTILDKLFDKWIEIYEDWLYTYKLRGNWKRCSKCKEIKLATKNNFKINKEGKYGFYSICKKCQG